METYNYALLATFFRKCSIQSSDRFSKYFVNYESVE